MNKIERKNFIKKLFISGFVLVAFLAVIYLLFKSLGLLDISQEEIQDFISSTGVVAPLIYIGITFLQVTIIPMPSTVTILVGNYLFGPLLAFIYVYIGLILGSIFAYYLGKWFGRPFINWLSGSKEQTEMWMGKLHGKETVLLFFMFLFPIFPDDLLCAIAGILLPITFTRFLFMQIITRATTAGATLVFLTGDVIPFSGWGIPVIIAGVLLCIVAFIICFRKADKIDALLRKIYKKIFKRNTIKEKINEGE